MADEMQTNPGSSDKKGIKPDVINGQDLKAYFEVALTWLKTNQQTVNSLNVFPVPDGDTGTNMLLTMQAANQEITNSGEKNIGKMAHAIAQGALMGARGNSGVILSQILRGFSRSLDNFEVMDIHILSDALAEAKNTAYKGVVRPVEGTILTVIKDISIKAESSLTKNPSLMELLEIIVEEADESVKRTPELLPVLKQAGVVDSGGKGLFFLFEGILRHLKGLPLETAVTTIQPLAAMQLDETMESIEPGQDFELVIDFIPAKELVLEQLYEDLSSMGTSIQLGEGDGMYRLHIHVPTENKFAPIDYTMHLGTVTKVGIENLIAQMDQIQSAKSPKLALTSVEPGQIAVVSVSPGPGISRIFASLGVAAIVEGGQTMNPSTEEILHSFENLPTDKIIILPNNKNIIMAAQSTTSITVKKVAVIPSTSTPQGLSALLRLNPDGDFEDIVNEMNDALQDVTTGEITRATRSVELNGIQVHEGEVIALVNNNIVCASDSIKNACISMLEKADTQQRERITLFSGADITKNEVNDIVDAIRSAYPHHEIELHEGGQPHYQFIVAIE